MKNLTLKKHVPMRTCIVTKEKRPKSELIRIVRTLEERIVVDIKGKLKGRGANILPDADTFEQAISKNALGRALKLDRKLSQEELSELRKQFAMAIEEKQFRKGKKTVRIRVDKKILNKVLK